MSWRIGILGLLAGCEPERVVTISGTVGDGPRSEAPLVGGGEVEVFDETGLSYAKGDIEADGRFEVEGPSGDNVYLVISAPSVRPTVFAGVTQYEGAQAVGEGELFAVSEALFGEWRETFSGCEGWDQPGGTVLGDIRMQGLTDPESGEYLVVTTGYAKAESKADDSVYKHCALQDDGTLAEAGSYVGEQGRFAIFGAPAGLYNLEVGYEFAAETFLSVDYFLWFPSDDAVSPRFPAWVQLPT